MAKNQVTEGVIDPVFVAHLKSKKVELRIGESKRGRSRFAFLTPAEARIVAYALLTAAEWASPASLPT